MHETHDTVAKPHTLDDFVGQEKLIRQLRDEVDAAIADNRAMPHMLLYGAPGLGKSLLPPLLARARGVEEPLRIVGSMATLDEICCVFGADPNKPEESVSGVGWWRDKRGRIHKGGIDDEGKEVGPTEPDIVVIDEAEAVDRSVYESVLHDIMEDLPRLVTLKIPGSSKREEIWVPPCTVILITNFLGDIKKKSPAVVDRCKIRWQFEPYEVEEVMTILQRHVARNHIEIDDDAIYEIAVRSGGIPRRAVDEYLPRAQNRLRAMQHRHETTECRVTRRVVLDMFVNLSIDDKGLTDLQQRYLERLYRCTSGRMSLQALASVLHEDTRTLQVEVEPILMRQHLVEITGTGRSITPAGRFHIDQAGQVTFDHPKYAFNRRASGD